MRSRGQYSRGLIRRPLARCVRCKTCGECRTIVSMKRCSTGVATAVVFFLAFGNSGLAQSPPSSDVKATVKEDVRTASQAVGHTAQTVGLAVADKARQAGQAVAEDAKTVAQSAREDSRKAAAAVEDGARTVSRTVKEDAVKAKEAVTPKSSEPVSKN
jgi:hypothetical protein